MAPPTGTPILIPFAGEHGGGLHFLGEGKSGMSMCESFTSLLNNTHGPGFFGVGGFEDGSFGFGRSIWPFAGIGDGGGSVQYASGGGGGGGGSMIGGGHTWQVESGDGGDCFTLPDLAISTPGMI